MSGWFFFRFVGLGSPIFFEISMFFFFEVFEWFCTFGEDYFWRRLYGGAITPPCEFNQGKQNNRNFDFNSNFKFQLARAEAGQLGRTGRHGGDPALANWNLKFKIWKLNFWNSSYFIVRKRPSDDHPTAVHRPFDDRLSTARREKIQRKTKRVSNDRSRHDDQFCPKIVKIGTILEG